MLANGTVLAISATAAAAAVTRAPESPPPGLGSHAENKLSRTARSAVSVLGAALPIVLVSFQGREGVSELGEVTDPAGGRQVFPAVQLGQLEVRVDIPAPPPDPAF